MAKIPGGGKVDRALRQAEREVKVALRSLSHQAGKLVARGDFSRAEEVVGTGRLLGEFVVKIRELRRHWSTVNAHHGEARGASEATALWEFYRPILAALDKLGGAATPREIERQVGLDLAGQMKPGDTVTMAGGRPRWKIMVRRARNHLIREGFIENSRSPRWRITPAGRRAAHAPTESNS